jgi:hypothetical protein
VQGLEEPLLVGQTHRLAALLAPRHQRDGGVLVIAIGVAFGREALVRLHQVLLLRLAAPRRALSLRLELRREDLARQLRSHLAEAPCLADARVARPRNERMT